MKIKISKLLNLIALAPAVVQTAAATVKAVKGLIKGQSDARN